MAATVGSAGSGGAYSVNSAPSNPFDPSPPTGSYKVEPPLAPETPNDRLSGKTPEQLANNQKCNRFKNIGTALIAAGSAPLLLPGAIFVAPIPILVCAMGIASGRAGLVAGAILGVVTCIIIAPILFTAVVVPYCMLLATPVGWGILAGSVALIATGVFLRHMAEKKQAAMEHAPPQQPLPLDAQKV